MHGRSTRAALGWLSWALLAATSACGERDPASSSLPAEASTVASASAAPTQPGDPREAKLEALLLATVGCEGFALDEAALDAVDSMDDFLCPAELEFKRRAAEPSEGDELSVERHAPAARVCERHLAHESLGVRHAAMGCLAEHADGLQDAKLTLAALLDQAMIEPDGETATLLFQAVRAIDPTRHGVTPRLVAVLRKRADEDHAVAPERLGREARARFYARQSYENRRAAETGVLALIPRSKEHAPTPEAVGYALELARAGRGSRGVVELIGLSDLEVSVACEAYATIATSRDLGWFTGLEGAASTRGLCKEQSARFVDALVGRLGGEMAGSRIPPLALRTLQPLIEGGVFDAAARARLRAAVAAVPAADRSGERFDELERLLR